MPRYTAKYTDPRYTLNKDKWSQPEHSVKVEKDIRVTLRGGVTILADVYRPDVRAGIKFPALLAMSPFGKDNQEMVRWLPRLRSFVSPLWDGNLEAGDIDYLVTRGYVFVVPDPRGIGHSEGEYVGMLGSMAEDSYDTIEWMAQQPWCDGNVGMTGICIFSASQLLAAGIQPPHLKTITPWETWGNLYRNLVYPGGVLSVLQQSVYSGKMQNDDGWTLGTIASRTMKTRPLKEVELLFKKALENPDIKYNPKYYALLKYPKKDPIFVDFLLNPNDGPIWDEMSPHTNFDKIKIPVYAAAPWGMELFTWSLFNCYESIPTAPRLFMWPPGMTDRPHHEYHDELTRWFDFQLKGIDTGIKDEPPIKMFVIGADKYRYEYEWPLARTKWTEFYLHPNSSLLLEPVNTEYEPDGFTQPSLDVTPIVHSVEYKTPPFSEVTEITGPIALYLYASIDTDDTNFMVDLMDVSPSGKEAVVSRGYLKASFRGTDKSQSKPWRPYHPFKKPQPVTPGEIYEYQIEMMPTSYMIKPGDFLKLVIRNQDNLMSQFGMWGNYHLPMHKTVSHKVYFDKYHPSHLVLPFITSTDKSQWIKEE